VIIATWKQLQPTPDSEIGDNNVIDQALAEVRAYNARNPDRPLAVKLRVWGGFEVPDWAMRLGGGAPIQTVHNGTERVLGPFWSPAYRQAWARFQEQLAAKYDSRPLIREVSITSCMSFTAEPFYLPSEPTVANPLRAAGYTDAAHRQCLAHAVADYAPWKASRLVLSLNPFYGLTRRTGDVGFTKQVMRLCRQTLGRRCVFDNHNLDTDPPKSIIPIFALMQKMGPEIEFQTFHTTPKDFEGTIKKGISLGASSIELGRTTRVFRWCQTTRSSAGRPCSPPSDRMCAKLTAARLSSSARADDPVIAGLDEGTASALIAPTRVTACPPSRIAPN
jgi:hypothetical protein